MNKGYYAIIPASVRYDKRLTPNSKLLYGEITALCNEKGFCWAGNRYFAELYGVSLTSISKWISALIECGYLVCNFRYKAGTKAIEDRCLSIAGKANTPITKVKGGIEEKLNTPLKEKLKDNNTVINNTVNNSITEDSNSSYDSRENIQSSPPSTLTATLPLQQAVEIYKQYSPTLYSKEFDKGLNDDYKNAQALFAAVDEGFTTSDAEQLFGKAEASAWLTTEAKNITFEWLIKKRKLVLNGKYDNSEPKEKTDSKQEKYGVTRRLW